MVWVVVVLLLLLAAAAAIGLSLWSLYVRGRRLTAELQATSRVLDQSLDAIGPSRDVPDSRPPVGPEAGPHGVR